MSHHNNPTRRGPAPGDPGLTLTPLLKETSRGRTETRTVTLFHGGAPSPSGPAFSDLARRLDLLRPLRDWLEIHGAFTPAAGVCVHIASGGGDPGATADLAPLSGSPVAACRVTATVRTCRVGAE